MSKPRKSMPTALALGALALSAGAVMLSAGAANAAGPCGASYPYSGYNGTDPNGFYAPDMRSYVGACLNSAGVDFAHVEQGPNGTRGTFGSPGTWDATASQIGFSIVTSPAVGLVAQMHAGEDVVTYGDDGKANGTLVGGDIVAYVDQVFSGAQALIRTYDSSTHQIKTFRIKANRYLKLSGGQGVRNGVISTPKPTPSATPTSSATASATPSTTPSPTPTATKSSIPSQTPSAEATSEAPSIAPTSTEPPLDSVTNKKSKTLAAKYGKAIGLGGVVIAILLAVVVVAAARRTDDTGD